MFFVFLFFVCLSVCLFVFCLFLLLFAALFGFRKQILKNKFLWPIKAFFPHFSFCFVFVSYKLTCGIAVGSVHAIPISHFKKY